MTGIHLKTIIMLRIFFFLLILFSLSQDSKAQELNLEEALGLENYEIKFGFGMTRVSSMTEERESTTNYYSRLNDSIGILGYRIQRVETGKVYDPIGQTFIEISRNFKPVMKDLQLSVGIRYARSIGTYYNYFSTLELLSDVVTDTIPAIVWTGEPVMVDGVPCDTIVSSTFAEFEDANRTSERHLGLTFKATKAFFNNKLFLSAGFDFMIPITQSHVFQTSELFVLYPEGDSRPPIYDDFEGNICSRRFIRIDLDPLAKYSMIGHLGVQYFPHPRIGIELQVRNHFTDQFQDGSDMSHKPVFVQLGWMFRLHDDFLDKKKMQRQQRRLG